MLDFFAWGHPLVEGVFAHFEDSPLGRVACLEIVAGPERGEGLVAIYKDGPTLEIVAVDDIGRARADWADAFQQRPFRGRRVNIEDRDRDKWAAFIRRLSSVLDPSRRPVAVAAVVVIPS
jgi:hypothetical protein